MSRTMAMASLDGLNVKRIEAGLYTFSNKHGASGEILKQPEGGWSIWSQTGDFDVYAPTYRSIKEFAARAKPRILNTGKTI